MKRLAGAILLMGAAAHAQTAVVSGSSEGLQGFFGANLFGDSFMTDIGISGAANGTITAGGITGLLAASTTVPVHPFGVSGATANATTNMVYTSFAPSPIRSSVSILDGGANDGNTDTCGGTPTSGCAKSYVLGMNASARYLSIPYQFRQYASTGDLTPGAWTAGSVVNPYVDATLAAQGTPMYTNVSGATVTFHVPASSSRFIGLTWAVFQGFTGPFGVTIDGQPQTAFCSGTATFTAGPCAPFTSGSAGGVYAQDFAVVPNQPHDVTVTNQSANYIYIHSADTIPPAGTANTNVVLMGGPNAAFQYAPVYDGLTQGVAATLHSEGLPIISWSQLTGVPGVNATSDVNQNKTLTCAASVFASHPNPCGYLHLYQTIYNAAKAAGYIFTARIPSL